MDYLEKVFITLTKNHTCPSCQGKNLEFLDMAGHLETIVCEDCNSIFNVNHDEKRVYTV